MNTSQDDDNLNKVLTFIEDQGWAYEVEYDPTPGVYTVSVDVRDGHKFRFVYPV